MLDRYLKDIFVSDDFIHAFMGQNIYFEYLTKFQNEYVQ